MVEIMYKCECADCNKNIKSYVNLHTVTIGNKDYNVCNTCFKKVERVLLGKDAVRDKYRDTTRYNKTQNKKSEKEDDVTKSKSKSGMIFSKKKVLAIDILKEYGLEKLIEEYTTTDISIKDLAAKVGTNPTSLSKYLKDNGIEKNPGVKTRVVRKQREKKVLDKESHT